MFTTMRRKRHSATMKYELGQGVEHFKRAATLAAQETSATVGPKVTAARGRVQPATTRARDAASSSWETAVATLVPLITAAGENVRLTGKKSAQVSGKEAKANKKNARKLEKRASKALGRKSGRRSGRLLGLAMAGAALGAGAAYAMRQRRAAQWEEYDGSQPLASPPPVSSADDGAFEPTGSATTSTAGEPATPEGMTASTTTGTSTTGTSTTGTSAATSGTTGSDNPLVGTDTTDQTASAQHSPTVARMASGQNTKD